MKRPIFVRPLSDAEQKTLQAGLRSSDAFVLCRCQILLASSRGENAYQIATSLGCNPQTARNAIHALNERGLPEALQRGSKRPHTLLAHKPRGQGVDSLPQPPGQKEWRWSEDHKLFAAHKEPVAQCDGAQVGPWQAQGCRARRSAQGLRVGRQALRGLRISTRRASVCCRKCRLIVH